MRPRYVLVLLTLISLFVLGCTTGSSSNTPEASATLAPAPAVDGTALATPTRPPTAVPTASTRELTQEERTTLESLPGVAEVIDVVEGGHAEALLDLTHRFLEFCLDRPPDSPPLQIEPDQQYSAMRHGCREPGSASYEGYSVDTRNTEGAVDIGGGLWRGEPLAQALRPILDASPRLVSAEGTGFRRYSEATGAEDAARYILWFRTEVDAGSPAINGLALEVETGRVPPVTRLAFVHRDSWPTPHLAGSPPSPGLRFGVTPNVRARVEAVPGPAEVLAAVDSGDAEALLALFRWGEERCMHPPVYGKPSPPVCETIGNPPGDRYRGIAVQGLFTGETTPEYRARRIIEPLMAAGHATFEGAWLVTFPWDGDEPTERYLLAFRWPEVSEWRERVLLTNRTSWDSILFYVEPEAARPVVMLSYHDPEFPAAQRAEGYWNDTRTGAIERVR